MYATQRRAEWLIACTRFNVTVVMTISIVVESGKVKTIRKDVLPSAKSRKGDVPWKLRHKKCEGRERN